MLRMTPRAQINTDACCQVFSQKLALGGHVCQIDFSFFCGTVFHIGYRPLSLDPGCSQYAVQLVWGLTFSVANPGIYISVGATQSYGPYMPTVLTKAVNSLSTLSDTSISPSDPANIRLYYYPSLV